MKFVNLFLVVIFSVFFLSCDTDELESPINISSTLVEMEGEGGQAEISITGKDWKIAEVVNKNGNGNIFGDVYSLDGNQIRKNNPLALELDGLGRIEGFSFSITRNTLTSLEIVVKENSRGKDYNFVIVLESGGELFEITVKQKKSQGYTFDSIEYSLKEGDGDSLYVSKGTTYRFDIQSSEEFSFSPISGINVRKNSYFESPEDDAFVWLKNDSVMVTLPSAIHNNEIYYNGDKGLYTSSPIIRDHGFENLMKTVTLPSGESEFFKEIQYRKRKISYTLHLKNNRTNEKKIIEGKWIEFAPTGEYTIKWK